MTASPARLAVEHAPAPARTRPAVAPVAPLPAGATAPTAPGRVVFVASCAGVLAATLVSLLALNVAVSGNAFVLDDLTTRSGLLQEQEQSLQVDVAVQEAPQRLDARARALGMVPAEPAQEIVPLAAPETP